MTRRSVIVKRGLHKGQLGQLAHLPGNTLSNPGRVLVYLDGESRARRINASQLERIT